MRYLLTLLLLPLVVVAAPVPKEKPDELLKRHWGKAVLPDGKCAATADAGGLTLTSDGGCRPELFETTAKTGTGVRTDWPAAGNFEATVKLVRTSEPSRAAPGRGSDGRIWSGLFVGGKSSHDVQSFVWLGRQLRADEDKGKKFFDHALWLEECGKGVRMGETTSDETVWVRLSRTGGEWSCGRSADGKKWTTWKVNADLSDAVTVGVFLKHTASPKCEAVFADFSVVQTKPVERK